MEGQGCTTLLNPQCLRAPRPAEPQSCSYLLLDTGSSGLTHPAMACFVVVDDKRKRKGEGEETDLKDATISETLTIYTAPGHKWLSGLQLTLAPWDSCCSWETPRGKPRLRR